MLKAVILFLALLYSVYGKVIVNDEILKSLSDNFILTKTKPIDIHIELPIVKDFLSVEVTTKKIESEPERVEKNEIHDTVIEKEGKVVINTEVEVDTVKKCASDINENLINLEDSLPCEVPIKEDNGTALILTPFIEKGQIDEARNASKVNSEVFLGFDSYSGFITVNKTYNSNLFFWYFPVVNKPVNETPWIIWLQGGPGASSLTGLFDEIGPFKIGPKGTLMKNPYSWLQNHSLVFIDNPVGTGYSFTDHNNGFVSDMATYGAHLHEVVKQLIQIFPELKTAPLFVAGESYAGKYVPALGMEIHKHKNESGSEINLQGLIIGNAYVEPKMISDVTVPFYYFGLINKEQIKIVDPLVKSFQNEIARNNSVAAKSKWNSIVALLLLLSHQKHGYNFLKDDLPVGRFVNFLRKCEVKKAIHVGDINFSFVNFTVNSRMAPDFLSSSKHIFEELLNEYRVLAYCGQLDQMLPCVLTSENYRTWKWNASSEFLQAARFPFLHNRKLAGYQQTGGHFTEAVIRGAGHMVPVDEPAPIQDLVTRWTHNQPFGQSNRYLQGSFVQEFVKNNSMIYL